MTWTDERLAERFDRIDDRFDQVDRRFGDVNRRFDEADRVAAHRFDEVDRRISAADQRIDGVREEVAELRQGMWALQRAFNRGSFGVITALIGVIGAILIKGG